MKPVLAFALMALAASASARVEPALLPRPGEAPAEQVWKQFLEQADSAEVVAAIGVVDSLYTEDGDIDPAGCEAHAGPLARALQQAPVSLTLWYAEMECARALADETRGETALSAFAALSRHALSKNPAPASSGSPMPALNESDAWLMAAALELQVLHAYYRLPLKGPYLLLQMAVYDPASEREQIWIFDLADGWRQLVLRDEAEHTPAFAAEFRQAVIDSGDGDWDASASAHLARLVHAFEHGDPGDLPERLSALAAEDFGAAKALFAACIARGPARCSERAIDSLLDYAEAGSSEALWLLALAHATGRGVPQDPRATDRLLELADRRLGGASATQAAAREWLLHYHHSRLPDALLVRLLAQAERGDAASAELVLLHDLDGLALDGASLRKRQRAAASPDARDPRIRARQAALLHHMGDPEGALRLLALASAGEPEAAIHLLRVHDAVDQPAEEQIAWHRLAGLHGSTASSAAMGLHLLQQGRFGAAQEWFSSALAQRDAAPGVHGSEPALHASQLHRLRLNAIAQLLDTVLAREEHAGARRMLSGLLLMGGIGLQTPARRPVAVSHAEQGTGTGTDTSTSTQQVPQPPLPRAEAGSAGGID